MYKIQDNHVFKALFGTVRRFQVPRHVTHDIGWNLLNDI